MRNEVTGRKRGPLLVRAERAEAGLLRSAWALLSAAGTLSKRVELNCQVEAAVTVAKTWDAELN